MATIDIWIQLENHPWDLCPRRGVDRVNGIPVNDAPPIPKTLKSPVTNVQRTVSMRRPLAEDALILRRYTENWAAPDDRKVNPWDLNEPDPTDAGTMGTIPGPVIECDVGDSVRVHFRNLDKRTKPLRRQFSLDLLPMERLLAGMAFERERLHEFEFDFPFLTDRLLPPERRAHSLHTHGFVFAPTSDGAYPLSPPDPSQPIDPSEAAAWAELGVTGFKQADRVPSGGTFTYSWNTIGWPSTAGVWLYHDHSICDMENVALGAIGIVVIRNPADTENEVEITPARLPGGSLNGSPVTLGLLPLAPGFEMLTMPHDLVTLGRLGGADDIAAAHHAGGAAGAALPLDAGLEELVLAGHDSDHDDEAGATSRLKSKAAAKRSSKTEAPIALERTIRRGDLLLEFDREFKGLSRLFLRRYRTPPDQALFLQLFHEMTGAGMLINGRKYMGNTPTMVAGPATRMRFGVVGMGDVPHTFHIHGHRWALPGPSGTTLAAIQSSAQNHPVSQFEDTRLLGPANSFAFTIEEGQGFMRASPAVGEWHMHCHVLGHMMNGMMGSLLIVNGGESASPLPVGKPCPHDPDDGGGMGGMPGEGPITKDVNITGFAFQPQTVTINMGDTVKWTNNDPDVHTATATSPPGAFNTGVMNPGSSGSKTFTSAGTFSYRCEIHTTMTGTVTVQP